MDLAAPDDPQEDEDQHVKDVKKRTGRNSRWTTVHWLINGGCSTVPTVPALSGGGRAATCSAPSWPLRGPRCAERLPTSWSSRAIPWRRRGSCIAGQRPCGITVCR